MRALSRIVIYGVLVVAASGVWLGYALYAPYQGYADKGVFVEFPRGTPLRTMARRLEENGVLRSRAAFEILCRWRSRRPLQAGEYFFDRPLTAREVFQILAEGRIYVRSVTLPEGLSMAEMAELVEKEKLCHREEFLDAARDPTAVRDLAPRARSLEGFLFPATYEFPRRVSAREITAAMVRRFRESWFSFSEEGRNPAGLEALEVVILASLVERETGQADERGLIAGVFYNRLRRGQELECDPTVIYALRLAGKYKGELRTKDLNFNSPYNTYRHRGLPPGPIANPGEAALRAALYPPRVDFLFFVSNTAGGHFFSATLSEHNRNVARYKRLLAENAARSTGGGEEKPAAGAGRAPARAVRR